jgi:hypothetical protein
MKLKIKKNTQYKLFLLLFFPLVCVCVCADYYQHDESLTDTRFFFRTL